MESPDGGQTFSADIWDRDRVWSVLNQVHKSFVGRTKTVAFESHCYTEAGEPLYPIDSISPTLVDFLRVAWSATSRLQHIYRNTVGGYSRLSSAPLRVSWVLIQACDGNPGTVMISPSPMAGAGLAIGPGDSVNHLLDSWATKTIDLRLIWVGV